MRVIEQEQFVDVVISGSKAIKITQGDGYVWIDTQGAEQLIEVLKEFVNDTNVP